MIPVGTHGLSCPSDEDYAAIALHMQCFAETVDAQLDTQLQLAIDAVNRPTIITTNLAPFVQPNNTTKFDVFTSELFNNSTFMSLVVDVPSSTSYIRIGSQPGIPPVTPYPSGLYVIGAYLGADSFLTIAEYTVKLSVDVIDLSLPMSSQSVIHVEDLGLYSTAVGQMYQLVKFPVNLTGEIGVQVSVSFENDSTTDDVDINSEGFFWITYVGPSELVEVA